MKKKNNRKGRCCGVYLIRCIPINRVYIGSSVRVHGRLEDHKCSLRCGSHVNRYLQRAWNKYGAKAFEFVILRILLDPARQLEVEQFYIEKFESYRYKRGFNLSRKAGKILISRTRNRNAQLKVADAHRARATAQWAEPVMRKKMMRSMQRAAKARRGEKKAKHSRFLKRKWKDPVWSSMVIRRQQEGREAKRLRALAE